MWTLWSRTKNYANRCEPALKFMRSGVNWKHTLVSVTSEKLWTGVNRGSHYLKVWAGHFLRDREGFLLYNKERPLRNASGLKKIITNQEKFRIRNRRNIFSFSPCSFSICNEWSSAAHLGISEIVGINWKDNKASGRIHSAGSACISKDGIRILFYLIPPCLTTQLRVPEKCAVRPPETAIWKTKQ